MDLFLQLLLVDANIVDEVAGGKDRVIDFSSSVAAESKIKDQVVWFVKRISNSEIVPSRF